MTTYQTIGGPSEGYFKDRGSKFLAFATPAENTEDVREHLQGLRKEYHDARHHCFGYVLGMKEQMQRANDDGEPSHSAGDPILGQIKSYGVTNTLVVVVRYFGGTKLGVAGLINAYKTAAAEALQSAEKVEVFPEVRFRLRFEYNQTNEAERLLSSAPIHVIDRKFANDCEVLATIHEELFGQLLQKVEPPSNLRIEELTEPGDPVDRH